MAVSFDTNPSVLVRLFLRVTNEIVSFLQLPVPKEAASPF